MQEFELSFAKIIIHDKSLAEVIINDNVEMDKDMVDDYHAFLKSHLKAPFSLLINKLNRYSYTFEAQQKIATIPEIDRMAVVVYRQATRTSTDSLISIPRKQLWEVKVFSDYDDAMSWLVLKKEPIT